VRKLENCIRNRLYPQFLQVTVCDVMATPIRNSIELYTMRELHFVLVGEPLKLLCSFDLFSPVPRVFLLPIFDSLVVDELVGLGSYGLSLRRPGSYVPSSCQPVRRTRPRGVGRYPAGRFERGGIISAAC
jgi:hypothetical protein